jgi:hypothetical protein
MHKIEPRSIVFFFGNKDQIIISNFIDLKFNQTKLVQRLSPNMIRPVCENCNAPFTFQKEDSGTYFYF